MPTLAPARPPPAHKHAKREDSVIKHYSSYYCHPLIAAHLLLTQNQLLIDHESVVLGLTISDNGQSWYL